MSQKPTPQILPRGVSQQILEQRLGSSTVAQIQQEIFAGPLPSPDVIAGYEKVLAGSADRIIKMAEREQGHRQRLQQRHQLSQTGLTFVGQLFAFLMGMSGVLGGVYLARNDKSFSGFGVFFTSLAALVGLFFYNQKHTPPKSESTRR